jgi:pimeloyl-ACP methyl ester carboxylesterase
MLEAVGKLRAVIRGPAQPVATLVMIHGIGLGPWFWEPWMDKLSERFRVLALSLPGHGEPPEDAGLSEVIAGVESVISALPEPPILVGHSMGALVAQILATRHPLRGLILISPLPPGQIFVRPDRNMIRQSLGLLPAFLQKKPLHISLAGYRALGLNLLSEEEVQRWFPKICPWPWALARDLLRPPRVDPMAVRCPVLVLLGKEDRLVPWQKGRILGDLYEAVVWRYDNLAHSPPLEPDGQRMLQDLLGWAENPVRPEVLESEGFGPEEGVGHSLRRLRRGEAMKRRSAYGQKQSARK